MKSIQLGLGLVVLMYVAYCLITKKVWIRKFFAWKTRDEYPKVFMMNIILGTLIGVWLFARPLLMN